MNVQGESNAGSLYGRSVSSLSLVCHKITSRVTDNLYVSHFGQARRHARSDEGNQHVGGLKVHDSDDLSGFSFITFSAEVFSFELKNFGIRQCLQAHEKPTNNAKLPNAPNRSVKSPKRHR